MNAQDAAEPEPAPSADAEASPETGAPAPARTNRLAIAAPSAEKWGAGLPSVTRVVKARNGMLTRTVVTK